MSFSKGFIGDSVAVLDAIDPDRIEDVARGLAAVCTRRPITFPS